MSGTLQCFRCGAGLETLSLPLSRQDQCPQCSRYLHVCCMCVYFDPSVARQCREDDAEEVMDKEKPNFCDWFQPAGGRFDNAGSAARERAEQQLATLFGEADEASADAGDDSSPADDLFR